MWELKGQFSSIWSVRCSSCASALTLISRNAISAADKVKRLHVWYSVWTMHHYFGSGTLQNVDVNEERDSWTCVWGQTVKATGTRALLKMTFYNLLVASFK